jgi:Na+/H+ antiporter NhaD/arsenite permease-like protein
MTVHVASIVVLLIVFIVGSVTPIGIGLLGFVAALFVGLAGGLSTREIVAAMPSDLFVTLTGITFLFAIVRNNGTLDLITGRAQRLAGERTPAIIATIFLLGAGLSMIGTFPPAAVGILSPIAMGFAIQRGVSPFIMGVVVALGASAGEFSPINVIGAILNRQVASQGVAPFPGRLFLYGFVFYAALATVLTIAWYVYRARRADPEAPALVAPPTDADVPRETAVTPYQVATLAGIVGLIVLTVAFKIDIGFAALTVALLLLLLSPRQHSAAVSGTAWPTILMITGIGTYVGVLQQIGTLTYVQQALTVVGDAPAVALATSYMVGVVSAFASTSATLSAITPIVAPLLKSAEASASGVISAIAVSATIVDISPFSTMGALLLANARGANERTLFRQLVLWTVAVILAAPLLAWAIFVLTDLF